MSDSNVTFTLTEQKEHSEEEEAAPKACYKTCLHIVRLFIQFHAFSDVLHHTVVHVRLLLMGCTNTESTTLVLLFTRKSLIEFSFYVVLGKEIVSN